MLNLRSTLRQKLLGYYFTNPTASHYLRELAEILGQDPANLSRELAKLEHDGLFLSEKRGLQRYFRLNRSYPLYGEVFNRMRRKRHETIYQVSAFISHQEAENALATAGKYLAAIRLAIQKRNPQMKLI